MGKKAKKKTAKRAAIRKRGQRVAPEQFGIDLPGVLEEIRPYLAGSYDDIGKRAGGMTAQSVSNVMNGFNRPSLGNVRDSKGGSNSETDEPRTDLDRNTVGRRIGICRQIFKWTIAAGHLKDNPFTGLPAGVYANPERFFYIDERTTRRVIEFANDPVMRGVLALNRLIGLRIPSEIQTLRWCDVDLSRK